MVWIKLGIGVFVLAALGWFGHVVLEHYRDEGREEVRMELKPLTDECDKLKQTVSTCAKSWLDARNANATMANDVALMRASANRQNSEVDGWKRRAEAAQAHASRILTEQANNAAERNLYLTALLNKAATPATTRGSECDEADAVSRDVAARRLLYFGNATDTGQPSPNRDGAGAGTGSLRISR